jgi:hypothetical protein
VEYCGKEAGFEYVRGIRKIFKTINQLYHYNVNNEGYVLYGANMLHTSRQIVNDDENGELY